MTLSHNPYDQPDDIGYLVVFLVAIALIIGVGGALYFGYDWVVRGSSGPSLAWLAGARAEASLATATSTPSPTAAPYLSPTPGVTPTPAVTATPVLRLARVGNTGGDGVYIRRSPNDEDRLLAWPDNTVLVLLGPETEAGGRRWYAVRDPRGNTGWIPGEYLIFERR